MVSDFIEEKGGYLALSDAEYDLEKELHASIKQSARVIFEYGDNHGYWDKWTMPWRLPRLYNNWTVTKQVIAMSLNHLEKSPAM